MSLDDIKKISQKLADLIKLREVELTEILLDYESHETVRDELFHSVDCLNNIDIELPFLITGKVDSICTFFPLNLPLYSLILFAVVPSFMARKVFVRAPERMSSVLSAVYDLLEINKLLPAIVLINTNRRAFVDGYASTSDVIIFTGQYENSMEIQKQCPASLFLYNGAGVNPIVVAESADLELAAQKTIEMRVFNSGQDCAGPDAILVDQKVIKEFLKNLFRGLSDIKIGDYHDKDVRVGKLCDYRQIPVIAKFLDSFKADIVYGGLVNFKDHIVYPTVVQTGLSSNTGYLEFFAPVFHVIPYGDIDILDKYFSDVRYKDHAMYVSLFGKCDYIQNMKHSKIFKDAIVNDIERGNFEYGGYGEKANYVSFDGSISHRPILISREIALFIQ